MFHGILGGEWEETEKSTVFSDFNLDLFVSKVDSLSRGVHLQPLFLYIPESIGMVRYRREITSDFQNQRIYEAFEHYSAQVEKAKGYEKRAAENNNQSESDKWHADAMYLFAQALMELYREMTEITGYSPSMKELVDYLQQYIEAEEFQAWKELAEEIHEAIDGQAVSFYIQKNKVALEEEQETKDFLQRMAEAFSLQEKGDTRPEIDEGKLTLFEKVVAERLIKVKKLDKKFRQLRVAKFEPKLLAMAYEVQFYLGFYRFKRYMEKRGYEFVLPKESKNIRVTEGYDAAMVLQDEDREIVRNDFHMGTDEKFFVITGANGGGKTTFARMAGQIFYFSQMGLMVPCRSAELPYFSGLLSHFSNEESEETGKGKLMEELIRLRPMMETRCTNCFVVLNELFTTAATVDAGIMGKKVLEHFMENNCRGIYVTHIQSLAEESGGIASMVAELEKDHHTRSFKIVRKPAAEGEYEDSLITEYCMTYEQIKKVIENK